MPARTSRQINALRQKGEQLVSNDAHLAADQIPQKKPPVKKGLVRAILRSVMVILSTIMAAIAVILPWGLRIRYAKLLRWFRNQLMQNSRIVRKWALGKRWEWDTHEN
jgi:hypothetical protein